MTPASYSPPASALEPALWLSRYGGELLRFARHRVASATAAEELVQDTFVSALGSLPSFREEASERTWLFTIMRRRLIDYYRQQARSPLVPLPGPGDEAGHDSPFETGAGAHWRAGQEPGEWAPADTELERAELAQQLLCCQDQLPPQQQAVFALRYVEEASSEEICEDLGLSPANYWVIIHRAKQQLRKCLKKNWFSAS